MRCLRRLTRDDDFSRPKRNQNEIVLGLLLEYMFLIIIFRLIIDKDEPQFELKLHKDVGRLGAKLMKKLNIEQQRAVLKALTAKDYMLLQGLPGTGTMGVTIT